MIETVAWYLYLQATALAAWPLFARAFAPLDDRGWAAAKTAGLLLAAWAIWVFAMVGAVPYARLSLAATVVLLGVLGWLFARRQGEPAWDFEWLRCRRRTILAWEGLFVVGYLFFAALRSYDPAIQGTEKPMDMAFLDGFASAQRLPTQDTWLSGYGVPYYYFGYFIFASLTKLSGVAPGVAYNLAAATVPALAVIGLGSLAWNATRASALPVRLSVVAAAAAVVLVVLAGNLRAPLEWLVSRGALMPNAGSWLGIKNFGDGIQPGVWPPTDGSWWFRSSRVVPNIQPDGITEFPFFSAYLSDLHPHFMALPLEALALTVTACHVFSRGCTLRSPITQAAAALALGALLVANTWDIAPFWLAYVGFAWLAGRELAPRRRAALTLAGPLGGVALFLPYFVGYGGPPLGLGIVTERTPLGSFLVLFGVQAALLALFGLWLRHCARDHQGWLVAGAGAAAGAVLLVLGEGTLGVLVALGALLLPWPWDGMWSSRGPAQRFALGLALLAVAILAGVELIFLRDSFGTRMNTVFKFDYNAWLIAGLAAAVGLAVVLSDRGRWRWAGVVCACAALVLGLFYPATAAVMRLRNQPSGGRTLDGLTFLSADERNGVSWLRDQIGGRRPVIAEAAGGQVAGEYSHGTRMATYSGAVDVLGWPGHELQWRGPLPELGRREADLTALYRDASPADIPSIIQRYGIEYVVVGDLERQAYGQGVTTRFDNMLAVAHRAGGLVIYRTDLAPQP